MAKLPTFKNDDAFADFVDTHDMADYWDEFEDVEVQIERPKKEAITIQLSFPPTRECFALTRCCTLGTILF